MISPEFRLVYLTAAGEWADEPIRKLVEEEELNWSRVFNIAVAEHAISVVYRRLKTLSEGHGEGRTSLLSRVPESVAEAFHRMAQVIDFRMGILQDRLVDLMSHLDEAGIEVVLLKGAGMACWLEKGFLSRPMGDLDLLVRPDDAPRAHALTQDLRWEMPRSGLRPHMYEGHHHLIQLDAVDGLGFSVEIHTDLFSEWAPFRFGAPEIWRHVRSLAESPPRTGTLGKVGQFASVKIPSPEHQLLHTCLHFAWPHTFRAGSWRMIRDVDVLLDVPELDRPGFLELAIQSRGATCVYWSLKVFEALSGRDLPPDLMASIPVRPGALRHHLLLRHLVSEALPTAPVPGTQRLSQRLWTLAIDPDGSGHGPGRPWTHSDRWPGPSAEELLEREPRPPLRIRFLGLGRYMAYLTGRQQETPKSRR